MDEEKVIFQEGRSSSAPGQSVREIEGLNATTDDKSPCPHDFRWDGAGCPENAEERTRTQGRSSTAPESVATSSADLPEGGTFAWLQVLGSFFLWIATW